MMYFVLLCSLSVVVTTIVHAVRILPLTLSALRGRSVTPVTELSQFYFIRDGDPRTSSSFTQFLISDTGLSKFPYNIHVYHTEQSAFLNDALH